MSWNPNKAHDIDMYIMDRAARAYPEHSLVVVNKWGHAVCGMVRPGAMGSIRVVEAREGKWEVRE